MKAPRKTKAYYQERLKLAEETIARQQAELNRFYDICKGLNKLINKFEQQNEKLLEIMLNGSKEGRFPRS